MWQNSKLWQDDHDEDEQRKNNSNQNYTVFQKKVHPQDFHDNSVKWKPI